MALLRGFAAAMRLPAGLPAGGEVALRDRLETAARDGDDEERLGVADRFEEVGAAEREEPEVVAGARSLDRDLRALGPEGGPERAGPAGLVALARAAGDAAQPERRAGALGQRRPLGPERGLRAAR